MHNNGLLTKEFKNIVIRWLRMHCPKKKQLILQMSTIPVLLQPFLKRVLNQTKVNQCQFIVMKYYWEYSFDGFFSDTFFRAESSQFYVIDPPHFYFRSLIQTIDNIVKLLSYIDTTSVKEPLRVEEYSKDGRFAFSCYTSILHKIGKW